jgi:hypothetical protein
LLVSLILQVPCIYISISSPSISNLDFIKIMLKMQAGFPVVGWVGRGSICQYCLQSDVSAVSRNGSVSEKIMQRIWWLNNHLWF